MVGTTPSQTIRWGFSGFGPRNSITIKSVVVGLIAERKRLRDLNFSLVFHVFEMNQNSNDAGSGHAFQTDCDATINSDITGAVSLANSHQIPRKYQHIVSAASDLASAVSRELETNRTKHENEFRQRNPAAFTLLKNNTNKNGQVDTSRAFCTRGLIGKVQAETIREVLDFAAKEIPELQIKVHYGHTALEADFSVPTKPRLLVKNEQGKTEWFDFDFVQLANGTTGQVPVSSEVSIKAFSSTPNFDAIRSFLSEHDVLDASGCIKPGSRIAVTGMRLSAYDFIPLLLNLTKMVTVTEDGWELNEEEAVKYQGLLTFVSHHDGEMSPPRHVHDLKWLGKMSFLSTEEFHTILLQQDFDWLSFATPILKANVAAEIGKLPSDIHPSMTTNERMAGYHRQNCQFMSGEKVTEVGLLRAGFLAMDEGYGFEADPELANKRLLNKAPLTREDRTGFSFAYSGAYDITQPAVARVKSNADFIKAWSMLQTHVAASPVAIQGKIGQLFDLGVARFTQASFADITLEQENQKVRIRDQDFDVVFAPKVLTSRADVLLQSQRGKVKEMAPGVPDYGKGRLLTNLNGEAIHAIDAGSGGHGTTEVLPEGKRTVVGFQWADTNHLAATDLAAITSRTLLLLSALKAQGSDTPVKSLLEAYMSTLPSEADFDNETSSLESYWLDVNERSCFLKAIQRGFAGNQWASLARHADQGIDRLERKHCIDVLDKEVPGTKEFYEQELAKILPFKPVSRDHFFLKRHLTFTALEMERVWNKVFEDI